MQYEHVMCPACEARLRFRSDGTSKKINCPGCQRQFYSHEARPSQQNRRQPNRRQPNPPSPDGNSYDVVIGGKKLFSLSIPRALVNHLYASVVLFCAFLGVVLAILVVYQVAQEKQAVRRSAATRLNRSKSASIPVEPTEPPDSAPPESTAEAKSAANIATEIPKFNQVSTTTPHHFAFSRNSAFAYDVKLIVSYAGQDHLLRGVLRYQIRRIDKATHPLSFHQQAALRQGTGFLVDSRGIIATCAHVVHDASRINVIFDQTTYPAHVVAFAPKEDLALLQIETSQRPALPLETSGNVELAQEFHVAGFPLTTILGSGLKLNRGAVAGEVYYTERGYKRFQVDAPFNPGNSGGPLIDEFGRVIGIACSKYTGERISSIGLAAPASEIVPLLDGLPLATPLASSPEKLSRRLQAKRIAKSIAQIRATIADNATARYQVAYSWAEVENRLTKLLDGQRDASHLPQLLDDVKRMPQQTHGTFNIDYMGNISHYSNSDVLPFCYEQVGKLAFENLDFLGRDQWEAGRQVRLARSPAEMPNQPSETNSAPRAIAVGNGYRVYTMLPPGDTFSEIMAQCTFVSAGEQRTPRLMLTEDRWIQFAKADHRVHVVQSTGRVREHRNGKEPLAATYRLRLSLQGSKPPSSHLQPEQ